MRFEVENGSFSYPSGRVLFENISFALEEETVLTILGRNGVGKTTLLKCIMGILPWRTGTLKIDGEDVSSALHADGIAYVPQAHNITFSYTVKELVTMGRARYMGSFSNPSKQDYEKAENALELVGLSDLANRPCNKLSGGQLQMVYIARALAADPKVLILDEPESHLDFYNQFYVMELLESLVHDQKLTAIINTHYPEHALRLADKTLMLRPGDHLFGNTKEVLTEENIAAYFQVLSYIETLTRNEESIPVFSVTGRAN